MKRLKWILVAVLTLLVVRGAFALCRYYIDNKASNFDDSVELYVYPQTKLGEVLSQLDTVAKRPRSIIRTFAKKEVEVYMQPGHYVIGKGSSSAYVARMLNNCWQTPVNLTLSGTLRRKSDIAKKISLQMMVDSASVRKALSDNEFLSKFGFDSVSVFALFIPDTYEMYWTASVEEIFACQKKAYDEFWTEERVLKARRQGLSKMQASIVASIVSGETNHIPEMPDIASVYLNRLHKGMKLQADPTIAFCFDYEVNRILKKHLQVDSPYNTYKNAGLPPGPIYVPSKAALEAVLNPTKTPYIFFCADPSFNGTHRFAVSYSDHMANARAFQKALNKRAADRKKAAAN